MMRVLSIAPTGGELRMPGAALLLAEREEIRVGIEREESCAVIGERLGRAPSTVSREVCRNGGRDHYAATTAQRRADQCRQRPKIAKLVADPVLAKAVNADLRAGFSPAAISARLRRDGSARVCTETIYQALYSRTFRGITFLPQQCLRSRRRGRRSRSHRAVMAGRSHALGDFKTVHERPDAVADRVEAGHWEGDLITGALNRSAVITLVERSTRFTVLGHVDGAHDAKTVRQALLRVFANVPPGLRRTLTWDRGNEMAQWPHLEHALAMAVYFCDPHAPWQRPTNEHTNRQLRFWLPKGQDLRRYSPTNLARIADVLNAHPRRLLGWATPAERYAAAAMH